MSSNARRQPRAVTKAGPATKAAPGTARRQTQPTKKTTTKKTPPKKTTYRDARQRDTRQRGAGREARPTKPAGLALSLTLLATLIAGTAITRLHGSGDPVSSGTNLAAPTPAAQGAVTVDRAPGEWISWALLNRRTGALSTGGDAGTNSTESMVKTWIAADYLGGLAGQEPSAADLDLLQRMIRDSDDNAAETLYLRRGNDAVINRLISTCGLTDTQAHHGWWSLTQVSARDAARMGDCIADGKATNPRWTAWLLSEMRQVRGEGRFGVVEVRPGAAVKNGWTEWPDGTWHVNCLGITDGWSVSVLIRYPVGLGLGHGAEVCRTVTRQLAP
jgi:hypothetical protein